ncbi:hypothetical protein OSTOST_17329 [Ostertagia ostertagi]
MFSDTYFSHFDPQSADAVPFYLDTLAPPQAPIPAPSFSYFEGPPPPQTLPSAPSPSCFVCPAPPEIVLPTPSPSYFVLESPIQPHDPSTLSAVASHHESATIQSPQPATVQRGPPLQPERIPGTQQAYTFSKIRANKNEEVFRCIQCRKESRRRGLDGPEITIKVVGNDFLTDPCKLKHECLPAKYTDERGNRAVYEELQNVKTNSAYAEKKPVKIYFDL